MDRRALLKATGAIALGAPLASLVDPTGASATDPIAGGYDVAVVEQTTNTVYLHSVSDTAAWDDSTRKWLWYPPIAEVNGYNTWTNLSDIRFRQTTRYGWVALVTASYGKAGVVNAFDDDALLWSARPYGNPHAIERIPDVGVVVVASADPDTGFGGPGNHPEGFLTIYAPQPGQSDDPSTLTKIDEFTFNGAHGLWYDGTYLWALGTDWLVRYSWTGSSLDFQLHDSGVRFPVTNGHGLDPDFSNSGYLLMTDGGDTRRASKTAADGSAPPEWRPAPGQTSYAGVKSLSRVHSGESFWVQARYVSDPGEFKGLDDSHGQWNRYVRFFTSAGTQGPDKDLSYYTSDGHIYKARVSSVDFS